MMSDETHLQRLQDYYATHRVLPSFAQIGELLGLKSSSFVAALAKRFKERGYLESGPTGCLAPAKRFFEREVVGLLLHASEVCLDLFEVTTQLGRSSIYLYGTSSCSGQCVPKAKLTHIHSHALSD